LSKEYLPNLSIKQWAEEDRPREKLVLKGKSTLSDAELLAILISTGTKNESAVELAKRILNNYKNDLNELGKLSVKQLMETKGIGEAKAITIIAALELGRRRQASEIKEKLQLNTGTLVNQYFKTKVTELLHEEFYVLYLNNANRLLGEERISMGGLAGTIADVRIIFSYAIKYLSTSIILIHNHPSGNPKPSQLDIDQTKKIKEAGKLLDIRVLDHVIIAETGFYSFADEGAM